MSFPAEDYVAEASPPKIYSLTAAYLPTVKHENYFVYFLNSLARQSQPPDTAYIGISGVSPEQKKRLLTNVVKLGKTWIKTVMESEPVPQCTMYKKLFGMIGPVEDPMNTWIMFSDADDIMSPTRIQTFKSYTYIAAEVSSVSVIRSPTMVDNINTSTNTEVKTPEEVKSLIGKGIRRTDQPPDHRGMIEHISLLGRWLPVKDFFDDATDFQLSLSMCDVFLSSFLTSYKKNGMYCKINIIPDQREWMYFYRHWKGSVTGTLGLAKNYTVLPITTPDLSEVRKEWDESGYQKHYIISFESNVLLNLPVVMSRSEFLKSLISTHPFLKEGDQKMKKLGFKYVRAYLDSLALNLGPTLKKRAKEQALMLK